MGRHNTSHAEAVRVSMLPFHTHGNVAVSAPTLLGWNGAEIHMEANEQECYS